MNTKEHIKQKLIILFVQNGIETITTKQVLEVAEVSNGKFFHHFKTKENLLSELFEDTQDELYACLSSSIENVTDLYEFLLTIWIKYTRFYFECPEKYLFLKNYQNYPTIKRRSVNMNLDSSDIFFKKLADCFKKEKLNVIDYEHFKLLVEYNLIATAEYVRKMNKYYDEKIIQQLVDNFWASLKNNV